MSDLTGTFRQALTEVTGKKLSTIPDFQGIDSMEKYREYLKDEGFKVVSHVGDEQPKSKHIVLFETHAGNVFAGIDDGEGNYSSKAELLPGEEIKPFSRLVVTKTEKNNASTTDTTKDTSEKES